MLFCEVIFVLSLMTFLLDFHASGCVFNCTDKPVFTPSRLVVKYGDPASVICNACQQECLNEIFNIEHSVGKVTKNRTTISWNIDNFTEWTARLQCYYNKAAENVYDPDVQCCTILPLTLYKPPDKVSISFANHTGPLIEAHPYTLQCTVHNVAPVEKVMAIFYRGHSVVGQVQVNNSYGKKPMTHSYTLDVTPHKGEDDAAYWCAAELVLGPEGPQPPPVVISQNMTTTVYYAPKLQVPKHPGLITINEGNQLKLDCSSDGNPSPSYNWTLPSGSLHWSSILTFESAAAEHEGKYTCTVSNGYWNFTEEFHVKVHANNIVYIILGILVAVVLLVIIGVIIWTRYYKNKRTGQYDLILSVCRFRSPHSAVPTVA
uniref:Hsp90 co-chaperone Cdc37-like n=1 Tax=Labrus bergylta TaxID=56723 RepID=A0A3Q3LVC7_9LABR|nr:vascular cell adhesion protein 1-like isoform X1 [Labrus bergylta]